jgi:hypothetical protein
MVPTSMQIPEGRTSYPFFYEKSIIERTMQYIRDRTKYLDGYFPCRKKKKCKLKHLINWLNLFADFHNKELKKLN